MHRGDHSKFNEYLQNVLTFIFRVYAEVYHADGAYQLQANDRFLPIRKSDDLQNFLNDIYSKTDVNPKDVEYVEANGAGKICSNPKSGCSIVL